MVVSPGFYTFESIDRYRRLGCRFVRTNGWRHGREINVNRLVPNRRSFQLTIVDEFVCPELATTVKPWVSALSLYEIGRGSHIYLTERSVGSCPSPKSYNV